MPLPTVSRKLAELEAHLGTRLLTRTTRRLALTEAGTDYVGACKRILEEVSDAERKASGENIAPKGELVLTPQLSLDASMWFQSSPSSFPHILTLMFG